MSITSAVGTTFAIASTYGSAKTMSAISNATSAVATLAAQYRAHLAALCEATV